MRSIPGLGRLVRLYSLVEDCPGPPQDGHLAHSIGEDYAHTGASLVVKLGAEMSAADAAVWLRRVADAVEEGEFFYPIDPDRACLSEAPPALPSPPSPFDVEEGAP